MERYRSLQNASQGLIGSWYGFWCALSRSFDSSRLLPPQTVMAEFLIETVKRVNFKSIESLKLKRWTIWMLTPESCTFDGYREELQHFNGWRELCLILTIEALWCKHLLLNPFSSMISQKFLKDPSKDRLQSHTETISSLLFGLAAQGKNSLLSVFKYLFVTCKFFRSYKCTAKLFK